MTSQSGRVQSPVYEVDSPVDGVDDPGGQVSQLKALTCSHRLLPNEPAGQTSTVTADFLSAVQSESGPVHLFPPADQFIGHNVEGVCPTVEEQQNLC